MINRHSIGTRLFSLVLFSAIGFLILILLAGSFFHENMMALKIEKITAITDSSLSIANEYYDRYKRGEMDEQAAKAAALRDLRALRFDGTNYLFGYNQDGLCILHGSIPSREGQNFLNEKDTDGTPFIRNLLALGLKGGGWTSFRFTKQGGTLPMPKVGYVGYFKPWDWIIGTGVYVDDVDQQYNTIMLKFGLGALVILLGVSALTIIIARSISRPIQKLTTETDRITAGDYSQEIEGLDRKDEIGELAKALSFFKANTIRAQKLTAEQEKARAQREVRAKEIETATRTFDNEVADSLKIVTRAAGTLEGTARTLTDTAGRTARQTRAVDASTTQASSNVQTVASAAEELTKSIYEIAGNIKHSMEVSQEASRRALDTTEAMKSLSENSARISDVINLINDIASQTNLLALNATIEAARAGEAGKGFAVVASEVKQLAGQTAKATEEISTQISAVQGSVEQAIGAIGGVVEQIDKVNEIGTAIASAIEEQTAATNEISRSVQEVAVSTQEVTSNISEVSAAAEQTGTASRELLGSAQSLSGESSKLSKIVENFLKTVRAS